MPLVAPLAVSRAAVTGRPPYRQRINSGWVHRPSHPEGSSPLGSIRFARKLPPPRRPLANGSSMAFPWIVRTQFSSARPRARTQGRAMDRHRPSASHKRRAAALARERQIAKRPAFPPARVPPVRSRCGTVPYASDGDPGTTATGTMPVVPVNRQDGVSPCSTDAAQTHLSQGCNKIGLNIGNAG